MQPLKIIVVGPVRSGKTTISNFLADATEIPYDYHPTQGVRILEFEIQNINMNNKYITKDIELWDCSGDHKYVYKHLTASKNNTKCICIKLYIKYFRFENCWPAIRKDVHGVILVYNEKSDDCLKEIQQLYDYFIDQTKLGPDKCVIFCYDLENKNPEISKIILQLYFKFVINSLNVCKSFSHKM
ncbi:intraflagellar transport protein 22 homolog isoform X2 [Xylocopa sonorina]|uniref:intraflagellar transport protein 22 homolog isoform X2 n=1 Tax=Xylocopa sonorina TaxID=1818115 RepID=UPI00403A91D3